jgi:murein DD-endopeptidase MepM/ murein hydrolase activator NlpD
MRNQKNTGRSFGGKGYYIALILCAAAIGISGYLYYHNNETNNPSLANPTVGIGDPDGNDVQVVAPDPTKKPQLPVDGPTEPGGWDLKTGMPVSGQTVMEYAMDCLSYNPTTRDWRVHNGIDIAAEAGTAVCAAADGTVYTVYEDDTMGNTVVIRHDGGYVTTYASLDADISVAPGDRVTLGQTIGKVANTALLETEVGDHLHFCVTRNDKPMDPNEFLGID